MNLAEQVYRLTQTWPREELYGLTSQVRRAATSIPSNIAEGYGRQSRASYLSFLKIARGSLNEVETQLLLAERLGMTTSEANAPVLGRCASVGRLLGGLIRSLSQT